MTVALTGDADFSVVTTLLAVFEKARNVPGVQHIVVDLTHVPFMDSSGLSTFIAGFRFARQDGLTFTVANPRKNVRTLLSMTGVAHMFAAGTDNAAEWVD